MGLDIPIAFVLLFSLGNLIQIPGWIFLAAAVLTLGQLWGGAVTYVAAVTSCVIMSGIRFRSYLIGTLAGLPIPIALYCIFFDILATELHVR